MDTFCDKSGHNLRPLIGCADPGCEQPGLPGNWILVGGKIVFRGGWKIGNQEVGQWLLFVQWTHFDQGFFREKNSCCKSFEDITYSDKENGQVA